LASESDSAIDYDNPWELGRFIATSFQQVAVATGAWAVEQFKPNLSQYIKITVKMIGDNGLTLDAEPAADDKQRAVIEDEDISH
jgi:hypothetical protein